MQGGMTCPENRPEGEGENRAGRQPRASDIRQVMRVYTQPAWGDGISGRSW